LIFDKERGVKKHQVKPGGRKSELPLKAMGRRTVRRRFPRTGTVGFMKGERSKEGKEKGIPKEGGEV